MEKEINWKNFDFDVLKTYNEYYKKIDTRICDYTFNCRYAWDIIFNIKYAIIEDCMVVVSFENFYNSPFMLMPLGEYDVKKLELIISKVKKEFEERCIVFSIKCIDEKYVDLFDKINIEHKPIIYKRDFSDYLYDANDLRYLKGRKYSKKRNHLNNFINSYPNYKYEHIDNSNIENCKKFIKYWFEKKQIDIRDYDESDYFMIMRILDNYDKLDVYGGIIKISHTIIALSIASIQEINNEKVAYIHFEKADSDYEGSYVAINKLFLENDLIDVNFVNREEDLGIEGLRFAKESYFPIGFVDKYNMDF